MPSFDFTGGSLPGGASVARASLATFTDATGTIRYAAHNLLTFSEQADNAGWGKIATTITADTTVAPDGNMTADTWTSDGTNNGHRITPPLFPVSDGGIYVASLYFKQGTARYVQLTFGGGTFPGVGYANFDLQNGVVTTTGGTLIASGIAAAANGFWRCYIVAACVNASNADGFLAYMLATGAETRVPSVTSSGTVAIWGAQCERLISQSTPGTYYKTTTTPYHAARFDYVSGTLKGLLIEGVSQNALTYSEQFDNGAWSKITGGTGIAPVVTANAGTAPDGTTSADQIAFDRGTGTTSSDISYLSYSLTSFVGNAASSIWLKTTDGSTKQLQLRCGAPAAQAITITGTWQRFTVASTSATIDKFQLLHYGTGDDVTRAFSVYGWGADLEAQAVASTYIQSASANGTRAADSLTLNWAMLGAADGPCYARLTYDDLSTSIIAGTVTSGSQTIAASALVRPWVRKVDYLAAPTVPPIRAVTLKDLA